MGYENYMIRRPALFKIMTIDYIALVGWLSPLSFWGVYIFLVVLGSAKANDLTFSAILAGLTLLAISVLIWRIRIFYAVFGDGIEATATISNVAFFRDRGRVEYVYSHQNQKYLGGNTVHKVKQTEALQTGQQVIVVIDRDTPKKAFIRDLYIQE